MPSPVDFDHVRLVEVSKHFGRRRAVSRISLTINSGEVLGLLGPNGSGKSTLISLLAALSAPSTGSLSYGPYLAKSGGASLRRRIGLLGHELYLYGELSARQNLRFFAGLYDLDPGDVVDAALERAGLGDRADEDVAGYSRGMRQRLALERALLHGPRLVLLDEPFTGLDDRAVGGVSQRIRDLATGGAIVVLTTHDLDLADSLVTRVALLRDGRLLADEPAGVGLRARYRTVVGGA